MSEYCVESRVKKSQEDFKRIFLKPETEKAGTSLKRFVSLHSPEFHRIISLSNHLFVYLRLRNIFGSRFT